MNKRDASSTSPRAEVKARLIQHDDNKVVVYIGDSPIEVRRKPMPGTFEKLVAMIEKANHV